LLSTNSVSLLAEQGNRYLAVLRQKAKPLTGSGNRPGRTVAASVGPTTLGGRGRSAHR